MPAPTAALEAALKKVRDRQVGGNKHPSMLQTRTISLSRLVKLTARDLAREILLDDQTRDPDEEHWGENGNLLASNNLDGVACQEPSLKVRVPGTDWTLTGHADGLAFHDAAGTEWSWPATDHEFHASPLGPWYATVYEN